MLENGEIVKDYTITRQALEDDLHKAILRGLPVQIEHCLIDGNLDFTKGPKVPLGKVEKNLPKLKETLRDRERDKKKRTFMVKPLSNDKIPQEHMYRLTKESLEVNSVVLLKGILKIDSSIITGEVLAERTAFPSVSFRASKFKSSVSFWGAMFLDESNFEQTTFDKGVVFDNSHFVEKADFEFAHFEEAATFGGSTFVEWVTFDFATSLHGPVFFHVIFYKGVSFSHAAFGEHVYFLGSNFKGPAIFRGRGVVKKRNANSQTEDSFLFKGDVNFAVVDFKVPEEVIFERVNLSQAYFRETHLDKVRFIEVKWDERNGRRSVQNERNVKKEDYGLLAHLYRQLKKNYEEARDYPTAGDFHYGEMEMTRRMHWARGEFFNWFLTKAYKVLSGYGENIKKALIWTGVILLAPALIYYWFGATVDESSTLGFIDSLVRSLGYMTFRISQTPNEIWAKALMIGQAILGPIQLALVALALRRKFRR